MYDLIKKSEEAYNIQLNEVEMCLRWTELHYMLHLTSVALKHPFQTWISLRRCLHQFGIGLYKYFTLSHLFTYKALY